MPTAGEYRHEPSGIPCHCYVRRRIHHSLCNGTKSCLSKSHNRNSRHKSANKKVTFDPVLRICNYEADYSGLDNDDDDDEQPQQHCHLPTGTPATTNGPPPPLDDLPPAPVANGTRIVAATDDKYQWVRDRITSIFTLCKNGGGGGDCPTRLVSPEPTKDVNNNEEEPLQVSTGDANMKSNRQCRLCDSDPVHSSNGAKERMAHSHDALGRPQDKYRDSKTNDSLLGPEDERKSRSSASSWEYSADRAKNVAPGFYSPPKPVPVRPHQQRRSSGVASASASAGHYEKTDGLPSRYDLRGSVTAFADRRAATPNTRTSGERADELSDEYIYTASDDRSRECESVAAKSTNERRRTESENLDGSLTVPAFESDHSYMSGLSKHQTEGDLSAQPALPETPKRPQEMMAPQSAPGLQTVVSTPYHIKFLNECMRAYADRERDDETEVQMDILAEVHKSEKFEVGSSSRRSNIAKRSLWHEVSGMASIALFWTGCAFLVALVYIFLFSCAKDDE